MDKTDLFKKMKIMLIGVAILFGIIFGYQAFKSIMLKRYLAKNSSPLISVSTVQAKKQPWQPRIMATGSLRATLGVDVTTELAGMVREIYFTPGSKTQKDTLLVKLNDDTEVAQLRSYQAAATLAKITYERDQAQYNIQAVSQATLDNDIANLKSQLALVDEQKSIIAKKNIHAPFSGKLGICLVYPGQYVNPGDKIVTLQQLDPIYVDFYLPQQQLIHLKNGQDVKLTADPYPGKVFTGKITAIDPKVDVSTRNVRVEATICNAEELLYPGMFGQVEIDTGSASQYITLPQNAISFNSYGEIVYIVKDNIAHQTFVEVGESRDNEIAILKGVTENDQVVTSGQLKLKNGSKVIVNNTTFKEQKILNQNDEQLSNQLDQEEKAGDL